MDKKLFKKTPCLKSFIQRNVIFDVTSIIARDSIHLSFCGNSNMMERECA